MLKKNKWEGKVKIYGINLDNKIRSVKEFIRVKKWFRIEHLTMGGWD